MRPGANGTVTSKARVLCGLLDRRGPGQHDQVGQRDLLAAGGGPVEVLLDLLEDLAAPRPARAGSLTSQFFCGSRRMPRTIGAAALVGAAEARCRRPGGLDQLRPPTGRTRAPWSSARRCPAHRPARGRRPAPGPATAAARPPTARGSGDRTHVAVQQLVPGLGECLGKLLGVIEPAPGDLAVDGVHPHRDVRDQHGGLALLRRIEGIRDDRLCVLGLELPRAGGALGQLPLVAVQVLQVAVAPLGRSDRSTPPRGRW